MAEHEDPLVGFHFAVEIQGVVKGYFTECSGLGSEHQVVEHNVVTEKGQEVVIKVPGRLKWENIVLKRGITSNMDIWDWRKMVEDGSRRPATTVRSPCLTRSSIPSHAGSSREGGLSRSQDPNPRRIATRLVSRSSPSLTSTSHA